MPGESPKKTTQPVKTANAGASKKIAAKATPAKSISKPTAAKPTAAKDKKGSKPVLLSGGNPQIAKADGDAPVQKYIAAIPAGWKRDVSRRLDALVQDAVPNVSKAIRWNSPFYGIEGQGWFVSFHVFTKYVKLTFFKGTSLRPVPNGGTAEEARWIDIHEDDFDEVKLTKWIKQASEIPGWGNN